MFYTEVNHLSMVGGLLFCKILIWPSTAKAAGDITPRNPSDEMFKSTFNNNFSSLS